MYICIKNNENTEKIIEFVKSINEDFKIMQYKRTTFIQGELKNWGVYVDFIYKKMRFHGFDKDTYFDIDFEDLATIYSID